MHLALVKQVIIIGLTGSKGKGKRSYSNRTHNAADHSIPPSDIDDQFLIRESDPNNMHIPNDQFLLPEIQIDEHYSSGNFGDADLQNFAPLENSGFPKNRNPINDDFLSEKNRTCPNGDFTKKQITTISEEDKAKELEKLRIENDLLKSCLSELENKVSK